MDIGTGKDLGEYGEIRCHLLDVADAGEKYNLFQYLRDAGEAIADVSARGKLPVLCGGSGLYVESVLKGLRLPPVPENPPLRASLTGKSLAELTDILAGMKTLHNTTDVDSCQRRYAPSRLRSITSRIPTRRRMPGRLLRDVPR